ncbi:UDP-glucose/GDP-mannose dehydrogenase family protein [Kitasatospora sp. RB6PN24]|uniref:UDP-glucose dehydrogenase family protein n=1 Tax=Kitasatospora humi TaxID=2893891 RepID=UPI001E62CD32|nr:UDP-glucose/GDP-mannose dehydrogenase family protein [Kitasatospora humi]MCC9310064.1 UDP-glucose/GDP-mannose dehydrogenase family protein [Kitasatospora humi]
MESTPSAPRSVAVFGAGYIGLVTAACLAELGHRVVVRDVVPQKVEALARGEVPFYEPGLSELITRNGERLRFTLDAEDALAGAEVAYVCVDTPPTAAGDADLSRVNAVVEDLVCAPHLAAVVVKSTVPIGTGDRIRERLDLAGLAHVGYASNPEFTAEGKAVADFMHPDRIVVGAADQATRDLVAALHQGVDGPVVRMDVRSAELTKLTANALLMTRISFANEVATLCEATGADVEKVMSAVGMDPRIGPHFLRAGLGWGGSCFPKDGVALKSLASNDGLHLQLLTAVIEVNNLQPRRALQRLKDELGSFTGKTVTMLGMAFKAHTDDMRQAPSEVVASRLLAEGAQVRCWDPLARVTEPQLWDQATRYQDPLEALAGADAAIVVTEWPQLRDLPWQQVAATMAAPVLFDGRNLLDPAAMRAAGFTYLSVGRH